MERLDLLDKTAYLSSGISTAIHYCVYIWLYLIENEKFNRNFNLIVIGVIKFQLQEKFDKNAASWANFSPVLLQWDKISLNDASLTRIN